MEEEQFDEIAKRLDKVIKLLALQSLEGKNGSEAIKALSKVGFKPSEIATLIGTTPNTVSVALNTIKKGNKHAKKE